MNKASGGGIPVELFQSLNDDAVKMLHSICQQIWKLSSGHRTGKGQFSFQSQRRAMPKIVRTSYYTTALIMPANLENSAVATGLEKVSFHSSPKERQCQRCSNYCTIALISHASKVMLKIL